ncbi:MAG: hypothetical protein ACWGQW_11210 [bacterium]
MSEERKEFAIDEETKARLIEVMKEYKPGMIGMLAMSIESVISRVPAPRLAVWLALELVMDSAARHAKKNPNPEIGETEDKAHAVVDMVREHVRSLSDEEFDGFVSEDAINEVVSNAMEKMKSMMDEHDCAECGACDIGHQDGESEEEEDPERLPN